MKFSSVAVVASIAAAVSAQSLTDLSQCAVDCLANGLPITGCPINDLNCACSNNQFVNDSASCIQNNCPPSDRQRALASAVALCSANSVSIPSSFPGSRLTTSASVITTQTTITSTSGAASTTTGPITTRPPTTTPTGAAAGNRTSNTTRSSAPTVIASGAGRLTTALSLVGLSIAAAYILL